MNPWLNGLFAIWADAGHWVSWVNAPAEVPEGDLCFILNCSKLVKPDVLSRNTHNLVIHASDLPKGKGWSPWTWLIVEGSNEIPLTLFEAEASVDSGVIYLQKWVQFKGDELIDEIRKTLAEEMVKMCQQFVEDYPDIVQQGRVQVGPESYYPRRCPANSALDPDKSISQQFNLLRVVDNDRYPAFFEHNGCRYVLKIEKSYA
ncbi:formyltransferase family protein [Chlorobium phaeovibrioides]|uniref:Methionyl-tRNA formyltransferase n=1 Tax=Chlorobium phaeovibrioides TaxID=1094 RepID=A0ABW9UQG8_CHLPH|nr:formyltransferase family protein [Chlorobium phaeovibrioides]MWV55310.1 methionyl-tRNA formyltransferase [Chlorobium phaeovibrioides]